VTERNIRKITFVDQKKENTAKGVDKQHQEEVIEKSRYRF
jgi:hypothetical protein